MKCFYHLGNDAVALCKNCSRGLCPDCAIEVSNGIACQNRCEHEVEAINVLINKNKSAFQKTGTAYWRNAIIYLLLGTIFIVLGTVTYNASSILDWYLIPVGAVFLLGAIFNFLTGRKFGTEKLNKTEP